MTVTITAGQLRALVKLVIPHTPAGAQFDLQSSIGEDGEADIIAVRVSTDERWIVPERGGAIPLYEDAH